MTTTYETIEDEGEWQVVVNHEHNGRWYFEGWGSFATEAEAMASIAEHKALTNTSHRMH